MTKILGISSSMRAKSHSRKIVRLTLDNIAEAGGETQMLDLSQTPMPIYNPDLNGDDANVEQAARMVNWADAFIIASPDYHGSMSGAVKNFMDYFWKEFAGKLFGYIVSSHEKGLTVHDQMRTSVRQCYGWSLPYGISFNGDQVLDAEGNIVDEYLTKRIRMLAHDLVTYGGLLHGQFGEDQAKDPAPPSFAQNFKK